MENLNGQIGLENLVLNCIIGAKAYERHKVAEVLVDIKFTTNFKAAMAQDELSNTICYEKVAELCQEIAEVGQFILLEALAYALIEGIYNQFSTEECPIFSLWIKVKKPHALEQSQHCFVELSKEF